MDTADAMAIFANLALMFDQVDEIDSSVYDFWSELGTELGVLEDVEDEEES
jgi:hypothetical protein